MTRHVAYFSGWNEVWHKTSQKLSGHPIDYPYIDNENNRSEK